MNSRLWCNPAVSRRSFPWWGSAGAALLFCACTTLVAPRLILADAPSWMHALTGVPLPEHDEKTDAVILFSEDILTVQPNGKMRRLTRRAYKILRVTGKDYGIAHADFDAETKVQSMHGWCIPAQGKDYDVKDKDAIESSLPGVANGELVSDIRTRLLMIPAADPGSIVGYEIEQEERPFIYQDIWVFQREIPTRETRFTLQLPPGWEYKATWLNYSEVKPAASGNNQWQWVINDVKAIRREQDMPPWRGVAGQLLISFLPPGGSDKKGFQSWAEIGKWEGNLAQGRRDLSPELKQKVADLTAKSPTTLAKMKTLASFVQQDVRYVAIELGIGGLQPHAAGDIYNHHYGDCKDKATLLSGMLKEIGVESHYISINTTRGAVTAQTPPHLYWFNHEILGIRLPEDAQDASLTAIYKHPKLGRILIFDPTDDLMPFGQLRGALQANYGLLVTEDGGDLIEMPQLPPSANGLQRTGKFALTAGGKLSGDVTEVRVGDNAAAQRYALRTASSASDLIKPIESLLSYSLNAFQITNASVVGLKETDQPFQYVYSLVSPDYARSAGNLLLVRPRVIGHASSDILEKKEPRKYAVEFDGPEKSTNVYDITLPPGYEVDELPPPAEAEYAFGSYHSKTEVKGDVLRYTRSYEIRQLSVPVSQTDDLKKFYRIIANDERSTAVLKPAGH